MIYGLGPKLVSWNEDWLLSQLLPTQTMHYERANLPRIWMVWSLQNGWHLMAFAIYDVQMQIYLDPGAKKTWAVSKAMIFIAEKWLETKPPTWSLWLVFPLFSFFLGVSFRMKQTLSLWRECTLPETNIAAARNPSQKEPSLPTIHFQVRTVGFRQAITKPQSFHYSCPPPPPAGPHHTCRNKGMAFTATAITNHSRVSIRMQARSDVQTSGQFDVPRRRKAAMKRLATTTWVTRVISRRITKTHRLCGNFGKSSTQKWCLMGDVGFHEGNSRTFWRFLLNYLFQKMTEGWFFWQPENLFARKSVEMKSFSPSCGVYLSYGDAEISSFNMIW